MVSDWQRGSRAHRRSRPRPHEVACDGAGAVAFGDPLADALCKTSDEIGKACAGTLPKTSGAATRRSLFAEPSVAPDAGNA